VYSLLCSGTSAKYERIVRDVEENEGLYAGEFCFILSA
jgi:hypothetical protein